MASPMHRCATTTAITRDAAGTTNPKIKSLEAYPKAFHRGGPRDQVFFFGQILNHAHGSLEIQQNIILIDKMTPMT